MESDPNNKIKETPKGNKSSKVKNTVSPKEPTSLRQPRKKSTKSEAPKLEKESKKSVVVQATKKQTKLMPVKINTPVTARLSSKKATEKSKEDSSNDEGSDEIQTSSRKRKLNTKAKTVLNKKLKIAEDSDSDSKLPPCKHPECAHVKPVHRPSTPKGYSRKWVPSSYRYEQRRISLDSKSNKSLVSSESNSNSPRSDATWNDLCDIVSSGPSSPISDESNASAQNNIKSENTSEENSKHEEDSEKDTLSEKKGGVLLFSGGTNWDLIGRKDLPKNAKGAVGKNLWGPHRLSALNGIRVTFVASGNSAVHSAIVTDDGRVMTWGRNDKHQLGLGDAVRRDNPTLVETLKNYTIVSAACGRGHTLFLDSNGDVHSCGDNKMGQCGVGSQNNYMQTPVKVAFNGKPIVKIACGAEFSVILDSRGGLHSFGLPEYGQLGHNSDGRYFVTSNKMSFRCETTPRRIIAYIEKTREGHVTLIDDVSIVDVACGSNHCVALDTKKRCFSWGFGGYGRLGHAEPKDEYVPRLIKSFDGPNRGVERVFAGSTYSLAINEYDVLYFWGLNKKSGEATMYPKPVPDLVGWKVREVACANTSIVVLADDSVISWGPSPTYGELCYGENRSKSSTTPQEAKTLDGLVIKQVACGVGHTLLIARDETDSDKAKLEQLPEFTP